MTLTRFNVIGKMWKYIMLSDIGQSGNILTLRVKENKCHSCRTFSSEKNYTYLCVIYDVQSYYLLQVQLNYNFDKF